MVRGNAVLSAAVASAGATNLDELSASAVPHIRSVAGAASASLYRYDATGLLAPYSHEVREQVGSGYATELYKVDPCHRIVQRLAPQPRIVHINRLVGNRWRTNPAYHDFYRRFHLEYVVCAWLTRESYGQPGFVGILLTKTARQGDFSARELRNLQAALPALAGAVGRGLESEARGLERDTLEAILAGEAQRPAMAFDVRGKILWRSPQAAAALCSIPDDLLGAVRRLGEVACGRADKIPVLTLACRAAKQTFRADLSLARTKSGEPVVVVTLDFALPETAAAVRLSDRHGLTPAETRVLGWMLGGLSNAAIATRLDVSLETVRTQSKRALSKLGVSSRLQAVMLAGFGGHQEKASG